MAAMFIGNSALWLDPSVVAYFATADGIKVAKDFCAYLAKSLKEEEDQGWKELLAYAKASVEYGILKNKENAEAIIREYVLVGGQTVKPSAAETKAKADFKSFKVLTVATERRPALDNLIRSAKVRIGEITPRKQQNTNKTLAQLGFADLEVLGLGMEWEGNPMKVRLYLEKVESIDDDDLVLLVDSYDVLLSPEIMKIKKWWAKREEQEGRGSVVFAGETRCWPDESLSGFYDDAQEGKFR